MLPMKCPECEVAINNTTMGVNFIDINKATSTCLWDYIISLYAGAPQRTRLRRMFSNPT
jgi:hypothetical protein